MKGDLFKDYIKNSPCSSIRYLIVSVHYDNSVKVFLPYKIHLAKGNLEIG